MVWQLWGIALVTGCLVGGCIYRLLRNRYPLLTLLVGSCALAVSFVAFKWASSTYPGAGGAPAQLAVITLVLAYIAWGVALLVELFRSFNKPKGLQHRAPRRAPEAED